MKHSNRKQSFANSPAGRVRRQTRKQAIQRKRTWFTLAGLPGFALALSLPFVPSHSQAHDLAALPVATGEKVVFMILANMPSRTQRIIYQSEEMDFAQCDQLQRSIWNAPYPVSYVDDLGAWSQVDASCTPLAQINGVSDQ